MTQLAQKVKGFPGLQTTVDKPKSTESVMSNSDWCWSVDSKTAYTGTETTSDQPDIAQIVSMSTNPDMIMISVINGLVTHVCKVDYTHT